MAPLLILWKTIAAHDPRASFHMTPDMMTFTETMGTMVVIKPEIAQWCKEHGVRFREYYDYRQHQRRIVILNILDNKQKSLMFYMMWGGNDPQRFSDTHY
jgi:hypothetical protein